MDPVDVLIVPYSTMENRRVLSPSGASSLMTSCNMQSGMVRRSRENALYRPKLSHNPSCHGYGDDGTKLEHAYASKRW